MCLGKVIVTGADPSQQEIKDVVNITTIGSTVKVSTLFGEEHQFSDVTIDHVAMTSGVVVSLVRTAPR